MSGLVLLGVALRLRQYLANRSLWFDEANFALSFVDRGFRQLLWMPLHGLQSAPPGFIAAVRSVVAAFGSEDWALRLVPLIAGFLALVAVVLLARRELNSNAARVTFVGLTALSPALIYYSSEFKPYSSDALIALCIMTALSYRNSRYGTWCVAAAGFFGLIFSLPAVFVAAPAGLLLLWEAVRNNRYKPVVSVAVAWLAGAALHGTYIRKAGVDVGAMVNYWRSEFAPFPRSIEDFLWYPNALLDFANLTFRQTGPAVPHSSWWAPFEFFPLDLVGCLFALVLAISVIVAVWTKRAIVIVAVGAIVVTVFASALKIYPFSCRLLIFLVPLAFFVIATAIDQINCKVGRVAGIACAVLLFSAPVAKDVSVALNPFSVSEMRPALEQIGNRFEPGDAIAVTEESEPMYQFYAPILISLGTPMLRLARSKDDKQRYGWKPVAEAVRKNGYRRICSGAPRV
jgi:Dolichyl-phosphate-mannose-protein mannosyltransferase